MLQFANFGPQSEIKKLIEPSGSPIEAIYKVKNSTKPYACIEKRDLLIYGMLKFGVKSFYLPPLTDDSTAFFSIMAIAMKKNFKYKKEFDKL